MDNPPTEHEQIRRDDVMEFTKFLLINQTLAMIRPKLIAIKAWTVLPFPVSTARNIGQTWSRYDKSHLSHALDDF
jgi:hypothetical protein